MNESILITTIDGSVHRFDRNSMKNYDLIKDEKKLEKLLSNNILVIETNFRKISFINKNILKIEVI